MVRSDGARLSLVFGRPSPAADRPGLLRPSAVAADAAYRADGGDRPSLSLRAASIAGVRHRLAGEASDDAYAWRWIPGQAPDNAGPGPSSASQSAVSKSPVDRSPEDRSSGSRAPWLVVAVADGVGTVPGSALAAAAAVSAACDVAAGALARHEAGVAGSGGEVDASDVRDVAWWDPVLRHAADAVREVGGATTIVVAVVDATGVGAAARVGDSTASRLIDGEWFPLWPGDIDDDALSTATAALPACTAVEVADVTLPPGAALILLTDGVADPLHDGPTTVAPALASALAAAPTPLELAVLADFSRQGCFDDRTILGVWVRPALEAEAGATPI